MLVGDFPLLIRDLALLIGDLPLAAQVLLNLIGQNKAVHGQGGENEADVEKRVNIEEYLYEQRKRHRQDGDEKAEEDFTGKPIAAFHRAGQREQQDQDQRQQQKRVQGPAVVLPFRCDRGKNPEEGGE